MMKSSTDHSSVFSAELTAAKKPIFIALLGVDDASTVLVKAYFRLLLRLDYEISWVAANDSNAHLLLVSQSLSVFEKTENFIKNLKIPVIYVKSAHKGLAGGLSNHLLTLPLPDIQLLQHWLTTHVPLFASASATEFLQKNDQPVLPISQAKLSTVPIATHQFVTDFLQVIEVLRHDQQTITPQFRYVTLYDRHRLLIGVADIVQQQFWIQQVGNFKLTSGWSLKIHLDPDYFFIKNGTTVDLKQWLWQALFDARDSSRLAQTDQLIHLIHWPKPHANIGRRQILSILAVLAQQPMSTQRLAQHIGCSVAQLQPIIGSLYGSGYARLGETVQDWDAQPPVILQKKEKNSLTSLLMRLRSRLRVSVTT